MEAVRRRRAVGCAAAHSAERPACAPPARCGGGAGLAATLRAFADERNVGLIVAMTAGDEADGGRKGVALLPAPGDDAAAAAAAALQASLQAVPAGLPETLATQPLFISQSVATDGFGLTFAAAPEAPAEAALAISPLAKQITRKTMLPTILHYLAANARDA